MSKSTGNVIDPLEVIRGCSLEDLLKKIDEGNLPAKEVAKAKAAQTADFPEGILECGADALRFGLLAYTVQGRDVNLDIKRVVGYRQFCNKIWNAFKFAMIYVGDFSPSPYMQMDVLNNPAISKRDLFILSKLNTTIKECNQSLTDYLFGNTNTTLHGFFLYDVCDVYLELLKPVFQDTSEENKQKKHAAQVTLYTVLEQFLRLAHPLMPFITEELWQRLPNRSLLYALKPVSSIMISPYPETIEFWSNPDAEHSMDTVKHAIHGARSLRSDYRVANHIKADFYFRSTSVTEKEMLMSQADDFCNLAKGNCLKFLDDGVVNPKNCCVKVISDQITLLVDLTGILDIDAEIKRLEKEVERLVPQLEGYKRKMNAVGYEAKVPANVQIMNSEKCAAYETELQNVSAALSTFIAMKE